MNLYPNPCIVTMDFGCRGSSSIFCRNDEGPSNRRTWFRVEMSSILLQYVCSLTFLVLIGSTTIALQSGSASQDDDWKSCPVCAVPARIALNSSPGPTIVPKRDIYLFIEAPDFTVENLTTAFEKLSGEYPDPVFLRIVAFSNKRFLKQLISAEERSVIIDFTDSPAGREAQRKHYSELYPPKTGYFRSYYIRSGNRESFQYTPDPMKERTVQIVLRSGTKK